MKKKTSATTETGNKGRVMIDYSGKILHVGIDVHLKLYQICVFFDGLVLGSYSIKADAQILIDFLRTKFPGATFKCAYESCSWGFNLQRRLTASGIDCIVVHAGDIPGSDKEKKNKTDKVDAIRLARHHAAGLLRAIYVPDEKLEKHRSLVRYRKSLLGDLNCSKNRIKSLLKIYDITIPEKMQTTNWSKNFILWLEEQSIKDLDGRDTLESMIEQMKVLRQLLLKVEKKVRSLMHSEQYATKSASLTKIPGIGPITSSMLLVELGDIRRFEKFDRLNSFVGYYPGSHSSGDKSIDTGMSNRRHNQLRSMLIEAAWQSVRKDPAMLDAYTQLTKRMKGNKAIIRIARKLLRRVRKVMLTGEDYQIGMVA